MTWIVIIIVIWALAARLESFKADCEAEGEKQRQEAVRQAEFLRQWELEREARWQHFLRVDAPRKMGGKEMPDDWHLRKAHVLERDGHKCVHCGRTTDLQIHHINPKAISEDHSVNNLETVCLTCHAKMPGRGHSLLRFAPTQRDRAIKARLYAYTQRRSRKQHVCERCNHTINKGEHNYVARGYSFGLTERICEDCLLEYVALRH